MEKTLLNKYLEKKIEGFKETIEYKNILTVLEDLHPNRWEIEVTIPEDIEYHTPIFYYMRENPNMMLRYWRDYNSYKSYKLSNCLGEFKLKVIIHYPEINIKNRNSMRHKIRDLYVKIQFPILNPNSLVDLDGVRATVTRNEYKNGYAHSHLPQRTFYGFTNFCMGTSQFGCSLQKDLVNQDIGKVYQFMFLLQSYLEYESIEGTPYIRLEQSRDITDLEKIVVSKSDIWRFIKEKPKLVVDKNFRVTNRKDIEEFLVAKGARKAALVGNRYYSTDTSTSRINEEMSESPIFTFKEKPVKLKIDNYATEDDRKTKQTCHPAVTNAVIKYWENRIFETYIRNYRAKTKNTPVSTKEGSESNQVSM